MGPSLVWNCWSGCLSLPTDEGTRPRSAGRGLARATGLVRGKGARPTAQHSAGHRGRTGEGFSPVLQVGTRAPRGQAACCSLELGCHCVLPGPGPGPPKAPAAPLLPGGFRSPSATWLPKCIQHDALRKRAERGLRDTSLATGEFKKKKFNGSLLRAFSEPLPGQVRSSPARGPLCGKPRPLELKAGPGGRQDFAGCVCGCDFCPWERV